jgi:hypothetical protein
MNLGSWIWWTVYLFLALAVLAMLFQVIRDLFRRDDLSGWGKAGWIVFILVLPWLALLVYVISQSRNMRARDLADAGGYGYRSTPAPDASGQITRAQRLLASGAITPAEFETLKAKALR